MLLASVLERMGDDAGAWDHYYKASWSGNCRDAAWWSLARLAMKRGDVADALEKSKHQSAVQRQQSSGDGVESAGISQQWAEESSAGVYFRLSWSNTH